MTQARSAERLPVGGWGGQGSWRYELQWDGYRCPVVRRSDRVRVCCWQGTDLIDHFSDVQRALPTQLLCDVVPNAEWMARDGSHTLSSDVSD